MRQNVEIGVGVLEEHGSVANDIISAIWSMST